MRTKSLISIGKSTYFGYEVTDSGYIDRSSIRSLIGQKLIPDIHSADYRTVGFPLPLDILRFLTYSADITIVKACINESTRIRFTRAKIGTLVRQSEDSSSPRAPYVRDVDLNFSLEMLIKLQLVEKISSAYRLTAFGKIVSLFSAQNYFIEESSAAITDSNLSYDIDYLKMAKVQIDHQGIGEGFLRRKF